MSLREQEQTRVEVSVTIAAEPETVWRFLSEGEKLVAWMTAMPGVPGGPVPGSAIETRPGGKVRICYPGGAEARGEVVAVEPMRRIVFTWGYEPDTAKTGLGPGACRVEVSMVGVPEGTRVTLRQTGAMREDVRKEHEAGWRHYLAMLASMTAAAQHEPGLAGVLEDYFRAWNERDDGARREILLRCCEPGMRVRTTFACTDTVEELVAHIANGLRHMPGLSLVQEGPAQHLHGWARVRWVVKAPGGAAMFTGENVMRLSSAGRIAETVGFGGAA